MIKEKLILASRKNMMKLNLPVYPFLIPTISAIRLYAILKTDCHKDKFIWMILDKELSRTLSKTVYFITFSS